MTEQERVEITQTLESPKPGRSFHQFVKDFWHVLEPANPFIDNWHVGALAEHLTACSKREIRNLIINIFFRSAKSTITSVLFPAWVWGECSPSERFLCASFAESLAHRDADHCRLLILSEAFQRDYGNLFHIRSGQSAKGNYENDCMGGRRSIGTGGQTTGFGGAIRILDDPNDTQKTESITIRNNTNEWFDKTWSTRSDDFTKDVSIVIQQRTHKQDVTGHILEMGLPYELLKIPLEYDGKKYVTSIGWSDPREVKGESADPQRFPPEVVANLRKTLNIAYHGQAQQEPVSPEGNVIKRSWYNDCYSLPITFDGTWQYNHKEITNIVGYVDLAGSDAPDRDRTAMNCKIQLADGKIIKLWQWSGRWLPKERNGQILNFYLAWDQVFPSIPIHIESNSILGQQGMTDLQNMLLARGLNVRKDFAKVSKTERAVYQKDSYIASAEAERIEFYQGPMFNGIMKPFGTPQEWKETFFEESCALYYDDNGQIAGDHDDLLDDDVGAFNKLTKPVGSPFVFF